MPTHKSLQEYETLNSFIQILILQQHTKLRYTNKKDSNFQLVIYLIDQIILIFNVLLGDNEYQIYVVVRPGSIEFLKFMSNYYEIIIFTAGFCEYADPVITYLDPNNIISHKLYRENCSIVNQTIVKDLSTLNRSLDDIIIIDNLPKSLILQPLNTILIHTFIDDKLDRESYTLAPFLVVMQDLKDVRPVQQWLFKYTHFNRFAYVNRLGHKAYFEIANDVIEEKDEMNTFASPEKIVHKRYKIIDYIKDDLQGLQEEGKDIINKVDKYLQEKNSVSCPIISDKTMVQDQKKENLSNKKAVYYVIMKNWETMKKIYY